MDNDKPTTVLTTIGTENMPSVIKDPFKKQNVTRIYVDLTDYGSGAWLATGQIEFTNGQTSGKQQFREKTFDEVVIKIKQVIESLT